MSFEEKHNYLVLDLEMNQPSGKIIQIGAVVGDLNTGEIKERLKIYVNQNETLSPYIIDLCKITQDQVDSGVSLHDGYMDLRKLHLKYDCFVNPITWGGGDSECIREQLGMSVEDSNWCFGRRWIDVKTLFVSSQISKNKSKQGGLANVMTKFGLAFKGKKHDALDDAENTFILYYTMLNHFFKNDKV